MAYSRHINDKAVKLVQEGCVSRMLPIGGGVKLWKVQGERGVYMVATRVGQTARARCSCTAGVNGKFCSHALAGLLSHKIENESTEAQTERQAA